MIVNPTEWTIIFSKNSTAWGSFFYEPSEDVLRVTAKPTKHDFREYLTYEFPIRLPAEAVAEMQWEDLAVAWTIAVPDLDTVYLSRIREELKTVPGFNWAAYVEAIRFCLDRNINLPEALTWAETAISTPFVGEPNLATLFAKAEVLKSAQAAQARHQRARNSPILPGRSESVVRVFLRGRDQTGTSSMKLLRAFDRQVGMAVMSASLKHFHPHP